MHEARNLWPQFGILPARTESEAQQILICQKCFAWLVILLCCFPLSSSPSSSSSSSSSPKVLLHSSWRTNETSVT